MKTTKEKCPKKKPLAFMFWYGAETHELMNCFKDSKAKLIRAKAKAQNLPKSNEQAIDLLLSMPDAAMGVVRKWFQEKAKFDVVHEPEAAIEKLKVLPFSKIDSDEWKDEWRLILSLYSQDSIPESLINFLKSKDIQKNKSSMPVQSIPLLPIVVKEEERRGFFVTQEMVKSHHINLGKEQQKSDDNIFSALLTGVIAATQRDQVACENAKDLLNRTAGALGPDLRALICQFESNAARGGLRFRSSLSTEIMPDLDPERHNVVAEIKKILASGQFFASVIGMIVGHEFIELTPEEAKNLYPSAGEILAFPNTIPGHHHEGNTAIWRTERRDTEKQNKLVITAYLSRVYDVISVPHPSSDPDGLRQWLQSTYIHSSALSPIFELSDNVLVRLPGDLTDPNQFKFDKAIDLYDYLNAVKLTNGRRVVFGPLPAAARKLDCAPVTTLLKRLLKTHETGEHFPTFSRTQVQALCELAKTEEYDPVGAGLSRARERLESIADLKVNLNDVILDILSIPAVSKQIEVEKNSILQKFALEQSHHQLELEKLKAEKDKLASDITSAKKSLRAQEQNLSRQIRETFQKAQQEGIETLAQTALFGGLIGNRQQFQPRSPIEAPIFGDKIKSIEIKKQLANLHDLNIAVVRAAYASGYSPQLIASVISAARSSGAVGLVGGGRDAIAQIICEILAAGVRCSISLSADMFSLSDLFRAPALVKVGEYSIGIPFGDFLDAQSALGRTSVVELVGANRLPPESYLPDLVDLLQPTSKLSCIAWKSSDGRVKTTMLNSPVVLILGFVSGKSTFPFMDPLSIHLPIWNVDIPWYDENEADKSVSIKPSHMLSLTWSELWYPSEGTADMPVSNLDEKARLSMILRKFNCEDSDILAQALLEAGRPGCTINLNNCTANTSKLINQLVEQMRLSSSTLFSISRED